MQARSSWLGLHLVAGTAIAATLTWLFLPPRSVIALMAEGGPIENATVVAYLLAVIACWAWPRRARATQLAVSVVLLMFAARELDLHKALFQTSILKSRFYLSGPLLPKLEAIAILLPLAIALGYLLWRHARALRDAFRRREALAITTLGFILTLFISKGIDRSLNVLFEVFRWQSPLWLQALQLAQEETLELLLPVLATLAAWQARPQTIAATFTPLAQVDVKM